jgi:hypothetical protein
VARWPYHGSMARLCLLLALLALSCSSESSSRAEKPGDGGSASCSSCASVPLGGACERTEQCQPTAWPGVIDPNVLCERNVCIFDGCDDPEVAAKCAELGGSIDGELCRL